jgi:hypothetical protein
MFHPSTERFIATWREHREGRRLPARADLSPIDLGPLLPQVFMLGREDDGEEVFRLSGGLVTDLHGRDMRGSAFYALWAKLDRPQVAAAVARSRSSAAPVVIAVDARNERGDAVGLELCLAPLLGPSGQADRTIGLYQPTTTLARLLGAPVRAMAIRSVTLAEDVSTARPRLRLVVDNTRHVA